MQLDVILGGSARVAPEKPVRPRPAEPFRDDNGEDDTVKETTALYRHFNSAGDLLYVGISKSAVARLGQHMHGSSWAHEISRVEIEHLPSRAEALAAEKAAIRSELPIWNKIHNRPAEGPLVRSSRELMRASQGLPLVGKRLLALCLTRTDLNSPISIDAEEFIQSFSRYRDDRAVYRDLRAAAESLDRGFTTLRCGREMKWAAAEYLPGEAIVEFSGDLISHLETYGRDICYPLSDVESFSSTYPWRVFEIIRSCRTITVEDFCHATDAPKSCRKSFKDLRKRVIDPAISELQSRSIKVRYAPKKSGRKVAKLDFSFA